MSFSVSYISEAENERLYFEDYPSEKFIRKLADELKADEDELLLLSDKAPSLIGQRIREQPGLLRAIAEMDETGLERRSRQAKRKGQCSYGSTINAPTACLNKYFHRRKFDCSRCKCTIKPELASQEIWPKERQMNDLPISQ